MNLYYRRMTCRHSVIDQCLTEKIRRSSSRTDIEDIQKQEHTELLYTYILMRLTLHTSRKHPSFDKYHQYNHNR